MQWFRSKFSLNWFRISWWSIFISLQLFLNWNSEKSEHAFDWNRCLKSTSCQPRHLHRCKCIICKCKDNFINNLQNKFQNSTYCIAIKQFDSLCSLIPRCYYIFKLKLCYQLCWRLAIFEIQHYLSVSFLLLKPDSEWEWIEFINN